MFAHRTILNLYKHFLIVVVNLLFLYSCGETEPNLAQDAAMEAGEDTEVPSRDSAGDAELPSRDSEADINPEAGEDAEEPCQAREEICDNLDNDCDGSTDEALGGEACETGQLGLCAQGITECSAGVLECQPSILPQDELCNEQDDDCDGNVDEEIVIEEDDCDTELLGVCSQGIRLCQDGQILCSPLPISGNEFCDNLDNDCDGSIDEALGGDACETGQLGLCAQGITECSAGVLECQPSILPQDELCNEQDDDCDGNVDEEIVIEEDDCDTELLGVCSQGIRLCQDGQILCSPLPISGNEFCDNLDNDCDGSIDEALGGDACETGQLGLCAQGITECSAGVLECQPSILPQDELCNEQDDDCDGNVDEEIVIEEDDCDTELLGVCSQGIRLCQDGQILCSPLPISGNEFCDNLDNDCDGSTDEGTENAACEVDGELGYCAQGRTSCINGLLSCNPNQPRAEVCDGTDDDCDGSTDENIASVACFTGEAGLCDQGLRTCTNGRLICAPNPAIINPEQCNGIDDDCDGNVDENQSAEVCDNLDNDCDGSTDEDVENELCAVDGELGYCAQGRTSCIDGLLSCNPNQPRAEVCDGTDDDCDGSTDENIASVACSTGEAGLCDQGLRTCTNGRLVCAPNPAIINPEQCNNQDDDCDGNVDEDFQLGELCLTGVGECEAEGIAQCADDGGTICDSALSIEPEEESCDGLDNDCDGSVDEEQVCGLLVQQECKVYLGLSKNSALGFTSLESWGDCPQEPRDFDDTDEFLCTSALNDGSFQTLPFAQDYVLNSENLLGVGFICNENLDIIKWVEKNCFAFVGFSKTKFSDLGYPLWGECPLASQGEIDGTSCSSSNKDGFFHTMPFALEINAGQVSPDSTFAVSFMCQQEGEYAELAPTIQSQTELVFAIASSQSVINGMVSDGGDSWAGNCDLGVPSVRDNEGSERCVSTQGDGLFHTLQIVDGMEEGSVFGIALRAKAIP